MSPERFNEGDQFPECKNLCGRGLWKLVEEEGGKSPARG
jgi:hypothetical protein